MYAVVREAENKTWWHLGEGVGYIARDRGRDEAKRYEDKGDAQATADRMNAKGSDCYEDHKVVKLRR